MTEEYHNLHPQPRPLPQDSPANSANPVGALPASSGGSVIYGGRRLNIEDALSYLDQVKSQFSSQPDVYNQFLDIMKDFNTQRINTPGVINRVSTLFQGHPVLVEGFNTFLPPGYNIECSTDPNDPNAIIVTTPNGTLSGPPDYYNNNAHSNGFNQQQSQTTTHRDLPAPVYLPNNGPATINTALNNTPTPNNQYPQLESNGNVTPSVGPGSDQVPVEMDDAIGYVNKIKVRFTNDPHIYKSFLDLLQTYRREQRPIQDVYQQVAVLFGGAPDLLADFKKFLPDPDAVNEGDSPSSHYPYDPIQQQHVIQDLPHTSNGSIHLGNNREMLNPIHQSPISNNNHHQFNEYNHYNNINNHHNHSEESNNIQLPPYGNFQPPTRSQSKSENILHTNETDTENKGGITKEINNYQYGYSDERETIQSKPQAKIATPTPQAKIINQNYEIEPLPSRSSLDEEINFFDKVKKHIGNKINYNSFLKFLNLFAQGVFNKRQLVESVGGYIGDSNELFSWFKNFVNFQDTPLHIEDIVEFKKHRLELGLCKRFGPSYRQLPKAETYMPCSGRDEMCWEVLNDEWVGHPTWDSEESGYIAHRKNQYEDNLFRIEEERHEFDYYMENNMRTIQTLETIAQKISTMSPEEKEEFKLPEGLGHTSKTIYKKIVRKIYGSEKGFKVIDALHKIPAVAIPVVLGRLKQKDEEWRKSHREWNKHWRDQEIKIFYKSLDHLGLTFKQTDKKLLTTKQLISEISTIKLDNLASNGTTTNGNGNNNHNNSNNSNSKRLIPLAPKPKEQLEFVFNDSDIILDISSLIMTFINVSSYSSNDKLKLSDFFNSFVGLFFNLNEEIKNKLFKLTENIEQNDTNEDIINKSPKKILNNSLSLSDSRKRNREPDLLKDVLRRNKRLNSKKDLSDDHYNHNNNNLNNNNHNEEFNIDDDSNESWIQTISKDNFIEEPDEQVLQGNSFGLRRSLYNLFGNTNIYVFFRYFQVIYDRLLELKNMNDLISKEIKSRSEVAFAKDLDLLNHQLEEMGINITSEDCYNQVLNLSHKLIEGEIEHQWFEETLRQAYRNKAFKLFTIDKIIQGLIKHMHSITSDNKTTEMMLLFEQDRICPITTTKKQIIYRMKVRQLMNSEENMFRIEFNETINKVIIQFVALDDLTLKDKRSPEQQFNYYLTSYLMNHPTEGVPINKLNIPYVKSSIILLNSLQEQKELEESSSDSENNEDDESKDKKPSIKKNDDSIDGYINSQMKMKIDKSSYKLTFEKNSMDEFIRFNIFNKNNYNSFDNKFKKVEYFKKQLNGDFGWKNGLTEEEIKEGEKKFNNLIN